MIPIVTGAITGAALMGSVITNGAIVARRNRNKARLPDPPSYVDRYIEFQKANAEYEEMMRKFEQTLSKDQTATLLELKAKANDVQIKWQRCESVSNISTLEQTLQDNK